MLLFFQENLPIFTGKFYVFRRKTHDFSSKPRNQGIDKKIEKSIDTYRYFPVSISSDKYRYFSHHYHKEASTIGTNSLKWWEWTYIYVYDEEWVRRHGMSVSEGESSAE